MWTFTSNLGVPEIHSQKLELKDKEPFFYKVESIHASDVYYEILSMPDWISYLPQEKAMNAARFFINPNLKQETDTLTQKPLRIRGFNLEGDFQDIEIEITKAEEDSIIFGEFPQYDTSFVDPLVGEGKILKFEENNGNWVYVVNEVDGHLFEFDEITNSKKKFSTIKILNDNQKLIRSLELISNEQVSITDALLYSEGAHFLCGNFKGELNVGEKIYRSQGGYDFFLLELNYDGEITNFKIFGGSNDDFVRCIDLLHDQIILGGEFSSSTLLHGKEYQARGSNDYFLLSLNISKSFPINWVRVFDDEGSQSLTSLTTSDSGDIFICAATSNEGASVGSEHNLILRRTNSTGIFEREYILTSNGRLRNGHLKWNPYHNNLILIGEFENQIIMNNKNATSKGGFDIFLCSLDYSLRSRNLISIGGPLNDRISAFAIESDEFFLIAGTFYDSLSIGNNYLISEGSSDAFILKFDYEDFIFGDVFKQGSSGEDRIDAINVKSPNEIYFAGLSSHTNNPISKDLFLSRFYNQSTGPRIFGNYPNEIPCSRKFEFEIKSGLWSSESQKFHIRDYESEKAYKWLDISIDSQAGITISGISPNVPTEVPFDFQIVSNSGEELSVEFILKITNSSMDVPVILLPRPNEIFQFKESIISFAVTNMESVGLVEISSPPWVSLEKGDKLNEYELHFSPLERTLGLHEIGITAVGLNGSMQHKKFPVKVMPNLASGSSSSSHVDSNGWLESWFGYFFVSDEGWSYHEEFGWIFINSPESNTELWFWIPNLGWVWTNQSSALDGGLYLYLDEGSKWIFFKEKAYFDFSIDQWLSFENL